MLRSDIYADWDLLRMVCQVICISPETESLAAETRYDNLADIPFLYKALGKVG